MSEEMSAIDRYRAEWKPNYKLIEELRALYRNAELLGDRHAMAQYSTAFWAEMRPPRNLPIKRLDVVE